MAEQTKDQLRLTNQQNFPNNNTGFITPDKLRDFNYDIIDSLTTTQDSASLAMRVTSLEEFSSSLDAEFVSEVEFGNYTSSANADSASNAVRVTDLENFSSSLSADFVNTADFNSYTASNAAEFQIFSGSVSQSLDVLQGQIDGLVASGSGIIVEEEGAILGVATTINFEGSAVTASLLGSTATINVNATEVDISGLATTASLNAYTASNDGVVAGLATTASLNAYTSSNDSRVDSLETETGSLQSQIDSLTNETGSYATTSSLNDLSSSVESRLTTNEGNISTNTSDISTNASNIQSLTDETGSYATTGSNAFIGNQTITGDLSVSGTLTAQTIHTQYETASIIYSSGSTKFGDTLDDTHVFTGSVNITGSFSASLGEGYVWVGGPTGESLAIPSSSIQGVQFPYTGSAQITGSLGVTGSILRSENGFSGSVIDNITDVFTSSDKVNHVVTLTQDEYDNLVLTAGVDDNTLYIISGSSTIQYADNTIVYGKNVSGDTIPKGTPLFFTGSGTSGNLVGIWPADAGNPDRMPAGGIAGEEITVGNEGVVLLDGFINGVDTSAFESGDKVFVGVGGGYTNVPPTGSSNLIQFLGNVEKKDASNGSGVINMSGEERGLPNIQEGYVWVGDSDGVPQSIATSSIAGDSFPYTGTAEITGALDVSGSYLITDASGNTGSLIDNVTPSYGGVPEVKHVVSITSASYAALGTYDPNTLYVVSGSTSASTLSPYSGSIRGEVQSVTESSNTGSLDFSTGNFFSSSIDDNTHFDITNVQPGQTVLLRVTITNASPAVTFSSNVLQPAGSTYTPSANGKIDVLTFTAFDSSNVLLAAVNQFE